MVSHSVTSQVNKYASIHRPSIVRSGAERTSAEAGVYLRADAGTGIFQD